MSWDLLQGFLYVVVDVRWGKSGLILCEMGVGGQGSATGVYIDTVVGVSIWG